MEWVCTNDRLPLLAGASGLRCSGCGQAYPLVEGLPVFARNSAELATLHRAPARLTRIWERARARPVEQGSRTFREALGASSERFTTDWKFFVPISRGERLLEIGPGFGDDTLPLSLRAGELVSLVPSVLNARILRWRIPPPVRNVSIAVVSDLSRLPLADGSVSAIAVEEAAARAFGLSTRTLARVAAEWKRVLAPGGTVFIGLANPLSRRGFPETLNRSFNLAQVRGRTRGPGRRAVLRSMRQHGFGRPTILAPLPDAGRIRIVLPIENAAIVSYCLGSLLRRNALLSRALIALGTLGIRLALVRRIVPYRYLIFSTFPGTTRR